MTRRQATLSNKSPPVHPSCSYLAIGAAHNVIPPRRCSSRSMKKSPDRIASLVSRFETVYQKEMKNLPFVNHNIRVEAVGFRHQDDGLLGVLITPWFINLVLLPESIDVAECEEGSKSIIEFPSGEIEFTQCTDQQIGAYRSAALFRSVADFPDHAVARDVASRVMAELDIEHKNTMSISRRAIFTGRGLA